jgi:hypothetical protein
VGFSEEFSTQRVEEERTPDDPSNPTVSFHGEKRSNETHESTTDPEAKLARKGDGQPARLSYAQHALMDNRYGLLVDSDLRSQWLRGTASRSVDARTGDGKRAGIGPSVRTKPTIGITSSKAVAPSASRRTVRRT